MSPPPARPRRFPQQFPPQLVRAIVAALGRKHGSTNFVSTRLRTLSTAWARAIDDDLYARGIFAKIVSSGLDVFARIDRVIADPHVYMLEMDTTTDIVVNWLCAKGFVHFYFDRQTFFKDQIISLKPHIFNLQVFYTTHDMNRGTYYRTMLLLLEAAPNLRVLHMPVVDYGETNAAPKRIRSASIASPHLRVLDLSGSLISDETRAAFLERFGEKVKFE